MLEKLIVGRYLNFKDPKPKITFQIGSFVPQPKLALTIEQSLRDKPMVPRWDSRANDLMYDSQKQKVRVQQKQRVSQISAGENQAKVHRNFQWLGYYPGGISEVAFDNLDVLSGNFTGCWMMVYKKDGATHVGHVGTKDEQTHAWSKAVKTAWVEFANENRLSIERGFSPARPWANPDSRPAKIDGDGYGRVWGLVTRDELISIYLYQGEDNRDRYRIAGLRTVPPAYMPDLAEI